MPWIEPAALPTSGAGAYPTISNEFKYFAYDLLTGNPLGSLPMRGVSFTSILNGAGQLSGTIDMTDPRVQTTSPLALTAPNRTLIGVDYLGSLVWAGIVLPRKRAMTSDGGNQNFRLGVQCSELWSYFSSRVQATDYSAPPSSGFGAMSLWTATPWDANLIACQIIHDALGVSAGNLLGGMGLLLNGATPSGASPVAPSGDYVAVNYPFTSCQTVDTIVSQLSQLGLGVGFDYGVDVAYSAGPGSAPIATINIAYPRRGRTFAQNNLAIDATTARAYEFPEDGSQTANQAYEIGGSSAINVSQNINPINQGYPLWERVFSRAQAQSQNIIALLKQIGVSDLALYSYAPTVPTMTLSVGDPNMPLGSFTVGDNVQINIPQYSDHVDAGGNRLLFDPGFPAGLQQEWRIVQWSCNVADQGDSTVTYTFNQPPFIQAIAPAL